MQEKTKIAFYLDNKSILSRDLRVLDLGNPGIGGSEYMQMLTAQSLSLQYNDLEVVTYITTKQDFPHGMNSVVVQNIKDAILNMKRDACDILVLSNYNLGTGTNILELLDKYRMPTILWAHVFMNYEQYKYISANKYIRLFVCLGKQQLEMLRGLRLYKKATYINYMLPPVHRQRKDIDKKIVVYVGAMYPYKGFHILAKYWKYIKSRVKDAQLWVVGSAQLYGDNIFLGKYGIAESKYEREFIKYLLNTEKEIDNSVYFWGSLGGDKKENIVSQATVGVFNPCGNSETFGLSGVEFEAMGIPVVSIYKNSSLDIIQDKVTGLLYKDEKDFPEYIIRLLNDKIYNQLLGRQGQAYVTKEFDAKKIAKEWHDTIISVVSGRRYCLKHNKHILLNNQIYLHHANNFLKEITGKKVSFIESHISTGK